MIRCSLQCCECVKFVLRGPSVWMFLKLKKNLSDFNMKSFEEFLLETPPEKWARIFSGIFSLSDSHSVFSELQLAVSCARWSFCPPECLRGRGPTLLTRYNFKGPRFCPTWHFDGFVEQNSSILAIRSKSRRDRFWTFGQNIQSQYRSIIPSYISSPVILV